MQIDQDNMIQDVRFVDSKEVQKSYKDGKSIVTQKLLLETILTDELAARLGVLALPQGLMPGANKITIAREAHEVNVHFLPMNNSDEPQLSIKETHVHTFKAVRNGDDKSWKLGFKVNNNRSHDRVLKLMSQGGGWAGRIVIEPLQGELEFSEKQAAKEAKDAEGPENQQKLDWDDTEGNSRKQRGTDDDPNELAASMSEEESERKRAQKVRDGMSKENGPKKRGRPRKAPR